MALCEVRPAGESLGPKKSLCDFFIKGEGCTRSQIFVLTWYSNGLLSIEIFDEKEKDLYQENVLLKCKIFNLQKENQILQTVSKEFKQYVAKTDLEFLKKELKITKLENLISKLKFDKGVHISEYHLQNRTNEKRSIVQLETNLKKYKIRLNEKLEKQKINADSTINHHKKNFEKFEKQKQKLEKYIQGWNPNNQKNVVGKKKNIWKRLFGKWKK